MAGLSAVLKAILEAVLLRDVRVVRLLWVGRLGLVQVGRRIRLAQLIALVGRVKSRRNRLASVRQLSLRAHLVFQQLLLDKLQPFGQLVQLNLTGDLVVLLRSLNRLFGQALWWERKFGSEKIRKRQN